MVFFGLKKLLSAPLFTFNYYKTKTKQKRTQKSEIKRNKIYRRYVYMKVDKHRLTTDEYGIKI